MMEQKLRRDCYMGENLKKLRLIHGWSQEKLCAELQRRGAILEERLMKNMNRDS